MLSTRTRRELIKCVVRGITIYFNPSWGEASMYLLMAVVLLIRPRGLLGKRIVKFE
jgi:branched-chain amino acid transport system permease protein